MLEQKKPSLNPFGGGGDPKKDEVKLSGKVRESEGKKMINEVKAAAQERKKKRARSICGC